MYLDQRCWTIIKQIVDFPSITGKELEKQLGLSRKQLGYSIEKINDYLTDNDFPRIERLRTGKFRIPSLVIIEFKSETTRESLSLEYIYSDKERIYLLLLMLLCHDEELSTYHFMDELEISKNTLLLDLKKLQEKISAYNVNVLYSRRAGYTILGSEYAKRELLIFAIRKILEMPAGKKKIIKIGKIKQENLNSIQESINEIEEKLSIQFTDERLNELPYILYLILFRIRNNRILGELPETFSHINGTKEYAAVMAAFTNKYDIHHPLEKLFITAQIQISNIHSLNAFGSEVENQLYSAAKDVINHFEKICCIQIKEKAQLLEALLQHWKPAYYRIKYHYHIESSITDMVLPQHNYLHGIVKKAITPFEEMLEREIPDDELVYITVLFGGWLRREGLLDFVEKRKRAVVVCSNGVSVSTFLLIMLNELFPEIEFLTWLSVREFQEYEEDYNIVFTTVRLDTEKIQFIVKPFLNEYAKQKFREKVFQELGGVKPQAIKITELMDIIEQHSTIHSRAQLMKGLGKYINPPRDIKEDLPKEDKAVNLTDLLTHETVLVSSDLLDWQSAIRRCAQPLLNGGWIEPRYVDRIIYIIEKEEPYIMIADGVIIAHAGIDDGVNQVGMSLMRLSERISIHGYMEADIIIVLGTPDATAHLNALYRLIEILEDIEKVKEMRNVKSKESLIGLLK